MSYNTEAIFVLKQLGLNPNAHLPAEGVEAKSVYLDKGLRVVAYVRMKTSLSRAHRLVFNCPYCRHTYSVGRSGQHLKVHAYQPSRVRHHEMDEFIAAHPV